MDRTTAVLVALLVTVDDAMLHDPAAPTPSKPLSWRRSRGHDGRGMRSGQVTDR